MLGVGSLIIPVIVYEKLFSVTGISSLFGFAEPPLGTKARILIAMVAAVSGGFLGYFLAGKVIDAQNVGGNSANQQHTSRQSASNQSAGNQSANWMSKIQNRIGRRHDRQSGNQYEAHGHGRNQRNNMRPNTARNDGNKNRVENMEQNYQGKEEGGMLSLSYWVAYAKDLLPTREPSHTRPINAQKELGSKRLDDPVGSSRGQEFAPNALRQRALSNNDGAETRNVYEAAPLPGQEMPNQQTPNQQTPNHRAPEYGDHNQIAPDQSMSGQSMSGQGAPIQGGQDHSAPDHSVQPQAPAANGYDAPSFGSDAYDAHDNSQYETVDFVPRDMPAAPAFGQPAPSGDMSQGQTSQHATDGQFAPDALPQSEPLTGAQLRSENQKTPSASFAPQEAQPSSDAPAFDPSEHNSFGENGFGENNFQETQQMDDQSASHAGAYNPFGDRAGESHSFDATQNSAPESGEAPASFTPETFRQAAQDQQDAQAHDMQAPQQFKDFASLQSSQQYQEQMQEDYQPQIFGEPIDPISAPVGGPVHETAQEPVQEPVQEPTSIADLAEQADALQQSIADIEAQPQTASEKLMRPVENLGTTELVERLAMAMKEKEGSQDDQPNAAPDLGQEPAPAIAQPSAMAPFTDPLAALNLDDDLETDTESEAAAPMVFRRSSSAALDNSDRVGAAGLDQTPPLQSFTMPSTDIYSSPEQADDASEPFSAPVPEAFEPASPAPMPFGMDEIEEMDEAGADSEQPAAFKQGDQGDQPFPNAAAHGADGQSIYPQQMAAALRAAVEEDQHQDASDHAMREMDMGQNPFPEAGSAPAVPEPFGQDSINAPSFGEAEQEAGYSSLLDLTEPADDNQEIGAAEVEAEQSNSVVMMPGQSARRAVPASDGPVRGPMSEGPLSEGPASGDQQAPAQSSASVARPFEQSSQAAAIANEPADPDQAEQALRDALAKLQRMTGS